MSRYPMKCPFQGNKCRLGKHCTAVVLAEPPQVDLLICIPCQEVKEKTNGKEKERIIRIPRI